jgi:hypothetical protein
MSRVLWLILLMVASIARAQEPRAADSAQNYPVTVGSGIWNAGDNFGFGFGPWQFITVGAAGMFLGDSTQNAGDGSGSGFTSGGINSPNQRAWGLFANSGGTATAIRPFESALAVGETFRVDFDNGFIEPNSSEGILLATASGALLWRFSFLGGQSVYQIYDQRGFINTSLPFTGDGMHIEFTLTTATTYSATIRLASGLAETISGTLANFGTVGRFEVFDQDGGFNTSHNAYANNLAIVPEPGVFALTALGLAGALLRLR